MNNCSFHDRALGCIIGSFLGDSIGSYLEGRNGKPDALDVERALCMIGGGVLCLAPGQITDDSELANSLAEGLLNKSDNIFPLNEIAREYVRWIRSNPFDIGNTCKKAFLAANHYKLSKSNIKPNKLWADTLRNTAQRENKDSKSNGSLMRCSPLVLWCYKLPIDLQGYCGYQDSLLSHPNEDCCIAEGCYIITCCYLLNHSKDIINAIKVSKEWIISINPNSIILEWLDNAKDGILPDACWHIGWIKIAFIYAYYHLYNKSDYIYAIKHTISAGGDTDTNACIVGGMIGVYNGINNIPKDKIDILLHSDLSKGRPRPELYTTKNLLLLIEKLLNNAPLSIEKFKWIIGEPLDLSKYKKLTI